jgi:hypothetical protein
MKHRSLIISTALALAGASSAFAQMVPPPSETPAPEKSIPVTPPAPIPTVSPLEVKPAPVVRPVKEKAQPVVLPKLNYEPIMKKGPDGKVVRLSEPVEYAALKSNPMVTPKEREQLADYLKQRQTSFEIIVSDNLDLVEKIEAGIFETIPVEGEERKKNLMELVNVAKPLKPDAAPKPVYLDLRDKKVFSPEQAEFNRTIASEYYQALIAEVSPGGGARSLALAYKQYLDEPLYYHRLMKLEAAGKIDSLLPELKLDAETTAKVKPVVAKAKAAKTDAEKEAAINELNQGLSLDQRKALLKGVIASRGGK